MPQQCCACPGCGFLPTPSVYSELFYQLVCSQQFCDQSSSVQLLLLLQSRINSKPLPLKIFRKLISNPWCIFFSYALFQNTSIHISFFKTKANKRHWKMKNHTFLLSCDSYSIICKNSTTEFQFWSYFTQTPWKNRDLTNPNNPEAVSVLKYPFLNSPNTV